jgi:CheY-like chemotaxis protein
MESIGRLAGGIAHDFNNLLTAIMGYNELAQGEVAADSNLAKFLSNVGHAAERATNLTRQLLAFARRQIIEPKVVVLNDLIADVGSLLRRLIGEDIELITLPRSDLWMVKIDPGQFEQLLINLAVNARDAMPQGGKLLIETSNVTLDTEYTRTHVEVSPGDYAMLAVSDTGQGMDATIQQHIFEPFFTTKEPGRGTGLGLATVYGIVKQHGGHVWLYSEPGKGTTFKIYLPRAEEAAPETRRPREIEFIPCGTETILLVEDDVLVRDMAAQALDAQGYAVLSAASGAEALRTAQEFAGEIHLLLTDVVMPQMSGRTLAERLQSTRPNLKVLYASGYTDNTIVHHGMLEPGIALLQKPFTPASLTRKVRETLDAVE